MSIANKLYDVSHGKTTGIDISSLPTMYIDGTLPDVPAGDSYEGRLQIHNNVGACTVKLLSGDLPGGYVLTVDNTNSQVVLTWPTRTLTSTLPNNNFAQGDTGYTKGAGWSIVQGDNTLDPDDPGNSWEGLFVHQIGESAMMSTSLVPCTPGKTYTASIDVQTGNAREHSHGAAVRINFYDVSGTRLDGAGGDGNVVKQTTGNAWAKSSVSVTAPPLANYISGGFASYRMHQDYALWVDNFQWNVEGSDVGTDTADIINLSLQVKDSLGRTADWSGTINVINATVATLNFNDDMVTDSTGRVWTLDSGVVTDRWGLQPVTAPYLDNTHAKEGSALSCCPDTNVHDGTFDYFGDANLGVHTILGSGAPETGTDFCLELFARINVYNETGNVAHAFANLGGMMLGVRLSTPVKLEATSIPAALTQITNTPTVVSTGVYFHYALTRQGDLVSIWYNGTRIVTYSGGSAWNIGATSALYVGNGNGSSATAFGWAGQLDNVRFTLGWARYTHEFTPPSVPY